MIKKIYRALKPLIFPISSNYGDKPLTIQFPINNICNSGCQMCDIWKQKKQAEVSPEQLSEILSDDLYSEVTGVGINGGEPTLRKDIHEIARVLCEKLPKLQGVFLITNGISEKRVKQAIDKIADEIATYPQVKFNVMVSMDGVGEVHDRVRGKQGNFETAVNVVKYAKAHSKVDKVRIGCTVIAENAFETEKLLIWAQQNDVYARFRIGVPHQRLYSADGRNAFALTRDHKFHFANFLDYLGTKYEPSKTRRDFYRSLRNQVIYGADRAVGCHWQKRGVTILSDASLAYCAVESKNLGLMEKAGDATKFHTANLDHLREINETKCAGCSHDYESFPTRKLVALNLAKMVSARFIPGNPYTKLVGQVRSISAWKTRVQRYNEIKEVAIIPVDRSRQIRKVLLVGWYGTETLGDKGILAGVILLLQKALDSQVEITVASIEPYITDYTKEQVDVLNDIRVVSYAQARELIKEQAFGGVFMAGGPIMSRVSQCIDVAECFADANALGIMTGVVGCGVGPFASKSEDRVLEEIFKRSSVAILRDQPSAELAKTRGLSPAISALTAIDPATWWLQRVNQKQSKKPSDQPYYLLALRDWPIKEYALKLGMEKALEIKNRFHEEVKIFASELMKIDPEAKIIPFCMHKYTVGGDDRYYYAELFKDMPEVLANLDFRHRLPEEDYALFQNAKAVLTMRFHSAVFALNARTPLRAIDYTLGGKVSGLLHSCKGEQYLEGMSAFSGRKVAHELAAAEFDDEVFDRYEELSKRSFEESVSYLSTQFAP